MVFDKTGTLTKGTFSVTQVVCAEGVQRRDLMLLAASAEKLSTHPIARSVVSAYEAEFGNEMLELEHTEEIAGHGISALTDKKRLLVGNLALMHENGIACSEDGKNLTSIAVYVSLDGKYMGKLLLADSEKIGAENAISSLHNKGIIKTVMLTGDRKEVAQAVSEKLGIDEYRAELLPADKVSAVESLINNRKNTDGKLAFVGDGINDAPVLARADVGIAMGALGSDAAIEAADVVLMNDDLQKIGDAILLSRRTRRIVIQNIIFALGVKALVLILGALGIVGLNAAVFADVGVAVIAILNSMRNLKQ